MQVFRLKNNTVLVYFLSTSFVTVCCDKKYVVIGNQRVRCSFYRQPKSGGLYTKIHLAIAVLLRSQYSEMKIITGIKINHLHHADIYTGHIYQAKIIVWADAKFSGGHEKSYCKFAILCPNLYHLHRSNIGRLVDIEGHESGLLRVGTQLVVCKV